MDVQQLVERADLENRYGLAAHRGRRLDHGFLAPRRPVDELRKPAGPISGGRSRGSIFAHSSPFDQRIQLTAVGEVIFGASRHQTQRPDRQPAQRSSVH